MIGCALHLGMDEYALALLIAWAGHLRLPSDLMAMNANALIPPHRFGDQQHWGLLLYAMEGTKTSKAGLKDEGLMLDHPALARLSPVLRALVRRRLDATQLWTFSEADFRRMWSRCAEGAGLAQLQINHHQFRHGSAPHDVWAKTRTLEELQQRLRHQSLGSTRRYEKQTRFLAELNKLDNKVANYGHQIELKLPSLFLKKSIAPRPPGFSEMVVRGLNKEGATGVMSPAQVRRRLHSLMQGALSQTRCGQVFLDIFAGAGGVSEAWSAEHAFGVVRLDILFDPAHDLTRQVAMQTVLGWIASGLIRAMWLAPP